MKGEKFRETQLPSYDPEFRDRYWSREWQVPLLMGYIYLFDLDDIARATEAFKVTEGISGSPAYLKDLVQNLEKPGGQYEVGLKLIDFVLSGTKDPIVRERLIRRRESLRIAYYLFEMQKRHLKHERLPATDPWGGSLSVTPDGKVTTTTPHLRVFGLE